MNLRESALRFVADRLGYSVEDKDSKSFLSPSMAELGYYDGSGRIPEPGAGNYDAYLRAMSDESWVYACVSRRSEDLAGAPIALFDASKKKVEAHPLLSLLKNPNPAMDWTTFVEFMEASLLLTGNFYCYLDSVNGRGEPGALWPLMPNAVRIVPSKDPARFIDGYEYFVGGKMVVYPAELVRQVRLSNPSDYYYGLPPLAAARMAADSHKAANRWNLGFFNNSARVDMVLETPHSLDDKTRARMALAWANRYQGEGKAHRIAFLEKGTTAKLIGVNQKDMDFVLQKKMSREELCSVFKVPPAMVGLFEYANYANAQEQERIYWRSTLAPDARRLCSFLNSILSLYDRTGKLSFRLDESDVKALQEDEVLRSQFIDRYYRMGVPLNRLVDAYRLPFGHVAGGDEPYRPPVAGAPVMLDDEDTDEPEQTEEPKAAPAVSKKAQEFRAMKRSNFDRLERRFSPAFRASIRRYFDEQSLKVEEAAIHAASAEELRAAISQVLKDDTKLVDAMTPHLVRIVNAAITSEERLINLMAGKSLKAISDADFWKLCSERKTPERVAKWVRVNAIKWAEEINRTTYERLDDTIDQALLDGAGIAEVSKLVAETLDEERDYRTRRIAQTEVIASLNYGAIESYRDNEQVGGKAWLATDDEDTRESHRRAGEVYNENNPIPIEEPFVVGDAQGLAPGNLGAPEEDINCRCAVLPIVKEVA